MIRPSKPAKHPHLAKLAALSLAAAPALFSTAAARAAEPASTLSVAAEAPGPAGVDADAHQDRLFVTPTAETQPRGSLSFNSYELLGAGLSYGLTDRVQLSALTLLPVTREMPWFGSAAIKAQVARTGRLRLALQGSGFLVHDGSEIDDDVDDTDDDDDSTVGVFGAGAIGSLCLDLACHSLLNGYAGAFVSSSEGFGSVGFLGSIGVLARVTDHVKLLAEIDVGATGGKRWEAADGALAWYGVRFTSRRLAADLGFLRPIGADFGDDLLLGVPWVAFSYRAL